MLLAHNDRLIIVTRFGSYVEESSRLSQGVPRLWLKILCVVPRYSLDALESCTNDQY